jgi:hypothetical protein
MFIVGALIALFAGIAVINIQQQFLSNKRKAMIGEARQLGTALGFAQLDLGIYPRFCFLPFSDRQMQFEAQERIGDPTYFYQILDYTGIGTTPLAATLRNEWRGPYFAASQSRGAVGQANAGFVDMIVPEVGAESPFQWPADAYGNPWVLYLVSIDLQSGEPYFINGNPPSFTDPIPSPTDDPDYLTAVVSYGPNKVPGGGPTLDPGFAQATLDLRLYTGDYKGRTYTSLTFSEYTATRARAISNRFGTAGLASNDDDIPTGILDPGSDDIIYEF